MAAGSKTPLTTHGFKDATTDKKKIEEWWTRWPDANIGIPTGLATGWTIVDEDIKPWKGATGDKTMANLAAIFGTPPETLSQTTWSGGRQLIFAYHPEAVN